MVEPKNSLVVSDGDFDTLVITTIDLLVDNDYMPVNSSTGKVCGNFRFFRNRTLAKRLDSSCAWYRYDIYQMAQGNDWTFPWYYQHN